MTDVQSSQKRWNCPLCTSFAAKNLKGVVRHVGSIHAHDSNFRICCGIDGCHRTYRKFLSYKKHIYGKHLKISRGSGVGLLQDMEVSDDIIQDDDFDDGSSRVPSPTAVVQNKTSALFLLKLENEFKVPSTAIDCIIEDVTTLLNNEIESLHSELVAKSRDIVIDSEITSVFETVARDPFEGLRSDYFRDKYYREELQFLVSFNFMFLPNIIY